jgi:IclR family acetate operon transcriptional repressor
LDEVRRAGWAIDDEESEVGLLCVATCVPLVFGETGPRCAVSVTGLRESLTRYGSARAGRELIALVDNFEFAAHPVRTIDTVSETR